MARIDARLDRPLGTVDRRIFGSFTEHPGRCIYGGLLDEGSENSDAAGFHKDVLATTRDLGLSNVRWRAPGRARRRGESMSAVARGGVGEPGAQPAGSLGLGFDVWGRGRRDSW